MDLQLDLTGPGSLADRLYRDLSGLIASGGIAPGERLPSSRDLAAQLGIARATVSAVFERLVAEGYATARVGAGTYAATGLLPQLVPTVRARRHLPGHATAPVPRVPVAWDFRVGVPDASLFPLPAWRRHLGRESDVQARSGRYADPAGHPELRVALAHHLEFTRGLTVDPDGILVTDGAQHAFDLVARCLLRPGDTVAVEDPGYPLARRLFELHGVRIVPLPVDDEGPDPAALSPGTRLVYLTPTHQFPTGVVTTRRRRVALLERAARFGCFVIEDDYDSEYRFDNRPLEPLHTLDRAGLVAYVGTFSKALLPSLRVGYLVPPRGLLPDLLRVRHLTGWHGDLTAQGALARLLDAGDYAGHLRRARRRYRQRRRLVLEILGRDFAGLGRIVPSSAGLHLCFELDAPPGTGARIAHAAGERGVGIESLAEYADASPREGIVLGFGAIQAVDIVDGLRALRTVIRRVLSGGQK